MFQEVLWWKALASGWEMNVWDCIGTIEPVDEIREELDFENNFEYVRVGNFEVPIPKQFINRLTEKVLRKIEGLCWEILRFWHSGINISGTYPIPITLIERLEAILLKYSKPEVEEPDLSALLGGGRDGQ